MPFFSLILLAIIQGLTEFLPISSSGHLVLFHRLIGQTDQIWNDNLVLDVAVHMGTLLSVCVYFRRDIAEMLHDVWHVAKTRTLKNPHAETPLFIYVILASMPVIMIGFIFFSLKPDVLRSLEIMAWMTIIFGVVLGVADKIKPETKTINALTWRDTFIIGFAQSLALIPGVSRSGITMTAGRFLGFSRTTSAKFSLLLSIIAIGGAGTLSGIDLVQSGDITRLGFDALIAMIAAFFVGWVSIAIMMRWLEKHGFMPFVIYRIIMGVGLLIIIYGGSAPS